MPRKTIFICYSKRDARSVELGSELFHALQNEGYTVFFDDGSLPSGDTYDDRILEAVNSADGMIFLISHEALMPGAYTLTELGYAKQRWPSGRNRVLPVQLTKLSFQDLDPYLRVLNVLRPKGNARAEILVEARRLWGASTSAGLMSRRILQTYAIPVIMLLMILSFFAGAIYFRGNDINELADPNIVMPGFRQSNPADLVDWKIRTINTQRSILNRLAVFPDRPPLAWYPGDVKVIALVGSNEIPVIFRPSSTTGFAGATRTDNTDQSDIQVPPIKMSPQSNDEQCVTPPSTRIDVRRGAESTINILSPCHAGTLAELKYSGLKIAVPISEDGSGAVLALGFEANSAAQITFAGGDRITFDLPFKGALLVSRIAVVWDPPVDLDLHALEYGGKLGSEDHVFARRPRQFSDVRKSGGGYLKLYNSYNGVGQSAEIYTFFSRRSPPTGIVRLALDFASLRRSENAPFCGEGRLSDPPFMVLRSDRGQVQRPVIRRLASTPCADVQPVLTEETLQFDAVQDLLIFE